MGRSVLNPSFIGQAVKPIEKAKAGNDLNQAALKKEDTIPVDPQFFTGLQQFYEPNYFMNVTVLFSCLEPKQLTQQLMKAFKSVQITPKEAKEWKMIYFVTKSDPKSNLIPGIQCEVKLRMLKVEDRECFALLFTK